jgi:uncharacterized protein (TIGR01319 family)
VIVTCVDVGSTYTKAVVVQDGHLIAAGSHRTTVETDVLHGLDAAVEATGVKPDELLVCSSAGGGLRLAVVGYERLVTAQAGHRVGLSAGAKVVHVAAGKLSSLDELRAAKPDVVLLVGGADGGDEETITHNARLLARQRWRVPVVLAGNAGCRSTLEELLKAHRVKVTAAANVLPAIGLLDPGPARAAIRSVFLEHVIGGKGLSKGPRFASLVRGATPDVVLTGVEMLAEQIEGDLLVVDVGGATTDVYSVLKNEEAGEVTGVMPATRTVEGDLGMRWSAPGVIAAAAREKLNAAGLREAVEELKPGLAAHPADERIAELAVAIGLRRHARGEPVEVGGPRRGGRDLRAVQLVVGSGGVFRHRPHGQAERILAAGLADHAGGYPLPRSPKVVVDSSYVLAAAGLLAGPCPQDAVTLLADLTP